MRDRCTRAGPTMGICVFGSLELLRSRAIRSGLESLAQRWHRRGMGLRKNVCRAASNCEYNQIAEEYSCHEVRSVTMGRIVHLSFLLLFGFLASTFLINADNCWSNRSDSLLCRRSKDSWICFSRVFKLSCSMRSRFT